MLKDAKHRPKKILFTIGSPNQANQMLQIASLLPDYDCYFTQLYSKHPVVKWCMSRGYLENTILSGEFKKKGDDFLKRHCLRNDYAQSIYGHSYDMAVLCTDMLVAKELRHLKTVWVQEGMTDPVTPLVRWTKRLGLPSYFAMNTALNGSSNICDIYCAASPGYRQQFVRWGTDPSRIFVTGIPNYDNAAVHLDNDFLHRGYVLIATSDIRECFNKDNRPEFIRNCVRIAGGRPMIFKLHPNEIKERAIAEIRQYAPPDAMIFTEGHTDHMIANCEELITQYSTVVYTGIALGKKVHSYFDVEQLRRLAPVQNGGASAGHIAELCRQYIEFKGTRSAFLEAAANYQPTISIHDRARTKHRYHHSN